MGSETEVANAILRTERLRRGQCPSCGKPSYWRRGVHFDHLKRCGDGDCQQQSYDPDDEMATASAIVESASLHYTI